MKFDVDGTLRGNFFFLLVFPSVRIKKAEKSSKNGKCAIYEISFKSLLVYEIVTLKFMSPET